MFDKSRCDLCGDCLVRCQYVDYDRERAVREFTALVQGRDAEILRKCITCMACNEYCTKGANPFDLIAELQEKQGVSWPEETSMVLDAGMYIPTEVIPGDRNKPVLSLGSMEPLLPGVSFEGQLFDGMTIVKGGDYYCYFGYAHVGRQSFIKENARKFVDSLARLQAKEIVCLHDDCYVMLTRKAPEYGIEVPFKPVHIIQYLVDYLKEHKGSITRLGRRIAYQRPDASRYTPEKDPLLDELFELIGVERVARKHDRENALCCGTPIIHREPERAAKFQKMNVIDARQHGAEAMVFLCPMCFIVLSDICREHGLSPIFITDLCRMALGEKSFPAEGG